ncbi:COG4-domain-containing protein [Ramicandelaber brevisporus]|nr:COG4-domain-containing protein [Ramicandelaber brevisporus]
MELDTLPNLCSLAEIESALAWLEQREAQLDSELDELVASRSATEARMTALSTVRPRLSELESQTRQLCTLVDNTADIAESISAKVRELDQEQQLVLEAVSDTQNAFTLQENLSQLQIAMSNNNYEVAANIIYKYLIKDSSALDSPFVKFVQPSTASPRSVLESACAKLLESVTSLFDLSRSSNNTRDISRCVKLFPLLGAEINGLDRYAKFLSNNLVEALQLAANNNSSNPGNVSGNQNEASNITVRKLANLFEMTASVVDSQMSIVERYYGNGKIIRIIQRLEREGEFRGFRIVDNFIDDIKLQRHVDEVQAFENELQRYPTLANSHSVDARAAAVIDPRALVNILQNVASVIQLITGFQRFIKSRALPEIDSLKNNEQRKALLTPAEYEHKHLVENAEKTVVAQTSEIDTDTGLLKDGGLLGKQQNWLTECYLTLERFCIRSAVERAVRMDSQDNDTRISSVVEDVFYVIQRALHRTVQLQNSEVLHQMTQYVGKILQSSLLSHFQTYTSNGYQPDSQEQLKMIFMTVLNNMNVTGNYILKLINDLKSIIRETWLDIDTDHTGANDNSLSALGCRTVDTLESVWKRSQQQLHTASEHFALQAFRPAVRDIFRRAMHGTRYVIGEEEFEQISHANPRVTTIIGGYSQHISNFSEKLTDYNIDYVTVSSAGWLVAEWEYVLKNHFSDMYGGMLLEKEVRAVQGYFLSVVHGDIAKQDVKRIFHRIGIMAQLLSAESEADMLDVYRALYDPQEYGHAGLRHDEGEKTVTASELQMLIKNRSDFDSKK